MIQISIVCKRECCSIWFFLKILLPKFNWIHTWINRTGSVIFNSEMICSKSRLIILSILLKFPFSSYQQQKLRVCEICSAYLGIHDNDRRLADHFGGKLHLGFIKIREKLAELVVSVAPKKTPLGTFQWWKRWMRRAIPRARSGPPDRVNLALVGEGQA